MPNMYDRTKMNEAKMKQLDKIRNLIDTTTDKLGQPIEPKIKELVVMLNALDFPTVQSCEGHLDWSRGVPWVDVAPKRPSKDEWWRDEKIKKVYVKKLELMALRLFEMLEKFYRNRNTKMDVRMQLQRGGWDISIQPISEAFYFALSETRRKSLLLKQQKEVKDLTEFLRKEYLSPRNKIGAS